MKISHSNSIPTIKAPQVRSEAKTSEKRLVSDRFEPSSGQVPEIGYDKNLAAVERKTLQKKGAFGAKVGAALGAIGGVAAGLVGGVAGAVVGAALAPVSAIAGAVAGGAGGFFAVAKAAGDKAHVGGGVVGFYGGAALGAAAGAGGGVLGAVAGGIGGSAIGGAVGGLGVGGYELSANGKNYPNLNAELKEQFAKEAAREKADTQYWRNKLYG